MELVRNLIETLYFFHGARNSLETLSGSFNVTLDNEGGGKEGGGGAH